MLSNTNSLLFDPDVRKIKVNRYTDRFASYDFLFRYIMRQYFDRLVEIKRVFKKILFIGDHPDLFKEVASSYGYDISLISFQTQEDFLSAPTQGYDLIISHLNCHQLDHVPLFLKMIHMSLKKDGLLLGSYFGGDSLIELKDVMYEAEMSLYQGVSQRFFPLIDLKDMGHLLQKANFELPVVDLEGINLTYRSFFDLITDIRAMGQTNFMKNRHACKKVGKKFLSHIQELYESKYHSGVDDAKIRSTVDVIYLLGWH